MSRVTEESVSEDLGESQVLIRMVAAPITPNDLTQVKGFSAGASSGVAGNEGLGVVQAVGSAVTNVSVNDQVMPAGTGFGTCWRLAMFQTIQAVAWRALLLPFVVAWSWCPSLTSRVPRLVLCRHLAYARCG